MKKSEQNLRNLWDTIKWPTYTFSESQKKSTLRKEQKKLFEEIMAKTWVYKS